MGQINWGKHSYGDMKITGGTRGTVDIGKYCSFGSDIYAFMSHDHNIKNISSFPFGHAGMAISKLMKPPLPNKDRYNTTKNLRVVIGNDVWIGSNTVIFREVTIGNGAVIGAYSKITKDVAPYSIVVGDNRVVGKRLSDKDIQFLLRLQWWDFDDDIVAEIAPMLCSPDINALRQWAKERKYVS